MTYNEDEDCVTSNSPPVSLWSADASLATSDHHMQMDDELYIRRVFSFDEWEYNHPLYNIKSPLHREPISSNDMNRYHDSLKTLIQLPEKRTSSPSLFQEIWNKKLQREGQCCELEYPNTSFLTASTSLETTTTATAIPSPESAFRQFQKQHVSPIDTTLPHHHSTISSSWPSIPRESSSSSGGSFVHIDLDQENNNSSLRQPQCSTWSSIPLYILVPQNTRSSMEEEEEEVEL